MFGMKRHWQVAVAGGVGGLGAVALVIRAIVFLASPEGREWLRARGRAARFVVSALPLAGLGLLVLHGGTVDPYLFAIAAAVAITAVAALGQVTPGREPLSSMD